MLDRRQFLTRLAAAAPLAAVAGAAMARPAAAHADGVYICQGEGYDALFTWRDDRLCTGDGYDAHLNLDDGRIYEGESTNRLWTVRDIGSGVVLYPGDGHDGTHMLREGTYITTRDGYDALWTMRDASSKIYVCQGDGYDAAYTVRNGHLTPTEWFATLLAVGALS
ncbi:MAG: hypothetical protein AAGK21_15335 [Bacteroidota bacterium]